MRSSVWLLISYCVVVLSTIACGDSSGPSTISPASVALISGDAQPTPEVGTKLPLPLTIKVSDAQGNSVAGVAVLWTTVSGTLSSSSSTTDASGVATVEWTLGPTVGSQTATATVTGLRPVRFSVIAVAGPLAQIILSRDTVELLGIGDSFRLNARAADRFGNVLPQTTTVESADTSIVTADNFGSGAILTAHAADKTTSVQATAGTVAKTGTVVVLPPPCGASSRSSTLAVGQAALFTGSAASEFCLQGPAEGAEFVAVPYYSDFNGGFLGISISTGNTTIGVTSSRGITPRFQTAIGTKGPVSRDDAFETTLRQRSITELTPLIPAARLAKTQSEVRFNITVAVPAVAQTAEPSVESYQHVVLFFTRAVNELTPPSVNYYVGGFFFSRDLFPTTQNNGVAGCATSNFAEMFYMLAPDPAGIINGNTRTIDFVKSVTVATLAHEFQHLINASRHLYVNLGSSAFEDTFLDEGLAHVAEELTFYRSSGLSPRQNISYQLIQASPNVQLAFDNFAAANFRRFREYLLNPAANSPYINNGFIPTRGAIWSFLRYAADRRNSGESDMWFQLANPPPGVHGISNITRVVTPDLAGWVRDWTAANYVDDFVTGALPVYTHPSWNIRSVVEVVNQGMWALDTQQVDTTNVTSVGIGDGSAAYLRFGVRPNTVGGGRITARGAVVPPGFALTVLRTK